MRLRKIRKVEVMLLITALLCVQLFSRIEISSVTVKAESQTTEQESQIESGSVEQAVDIWDGTADTSWYEEHAWEISISTPEQLAGLAKLVNEGNSMQGRQFKLTTDIYLNEDWGEYADWGEMAPENKWTPIGNAENPFEGDFDGDGHSIYGMYVNQDEGAGLFGVCESDGIARIWNVEVKDSYVSGTQCVGGVVGKVIDWYSIQNCSNAGIVMGSGENASYIGGIVGSITRLNLESSFEVSNCYNVGKVSGGSYVGGLCGQAEGNGCFATCYNIGEVSGDNYVGGIVGSFLHEEDEQSTMTTLSMGKVMGNQNVGAFAGQMSCYTDVALNCGMNYYLRSDEKNSSLKEVGCDQSGVPIEWDSRARSEEEFQSGAVAYDMRSYGFGQDVGVDTYPVFKNDTNPVYEVCYNATAEDNEIYAKVDYANAKDYIQPWTLVDAWAGYYVEKWYTSQSYSYEWDFENTQVGTDRILYGKVLYDESLIPDPTPTPSPIIEPRPTPVEPGVAPGTWEYRITYDMMTNLDWDQEVSELGTYTTDAEGRPCMKLNFSDKNQRIFFELPENTDLSDYELIEIVADVPAQLTLDIWEDGFYSESGGWWWDAIGSAYPFDGGSGNDDENEGMSIRGGMETVTYRLEDKLKKWDYTNIKYVSIGTNDIPRDFYTEECSYYIYSLRFIDEDMEAPPTPVPTPTQIIEPTPVPTPTQIIEPTPVPAPTQTPGRNSEPTTVTAPQATILPTDVSMVKPQQTLNDTTQKKTVAKKKTKKLKKPTIRLSKGKTRLGKKCVKIKVKKYQGTHIQIYIRQKKGKFVKVRLKKSSIKKNRKIFKLAYSKGGKKLYVKVRTYKKVKGKKKYSSFSKVKKIRL